MDLLERMESGKLFYAGDPELSRAKLRCKELLYDFNHARPSQAGEMLALLGQLLGAVGSSRPCTSTGAAASPWGTTCTPTPG